MTWQGYQINSACPPSESFAKARLALPPIFGGSDTAFAPSLVRVCKFSIDELAPGQEPGELALFHEKAAVRAFLVEPITCNDR